MDVLITIGAERCQEWRGDPWPFVGLPNEPGTLAIGLRATDLPSTLGHFPSSSAVEIVDGGAHMDSPRALGALPPQLSRAGPKRLASFLAGRHCAAMALRAAGCADIRAVGITPSGAPLWPAGFVGSITHSAQMAVAAVAPAKDFRSIGIDCEQMMSSTVADELGRTIIPDVGELALAREVSVQMPWRAVVTVIFSAKESVYKCVRPLVDDFFEFGDVRVTGADASLGVLRLVLIRSLGRGFNAGMELQCRFAIHDEWVHTMTSLGRTAL